MPSALRRPGTLKLLVGLLIAVALGVTVYRLEQRRPIVELRRAGAEIIEDRDGAPRIVTFRGAAAGDDLISELARLTTATEVNLSGSRVTRSGVERLQALTELRRLDLSDTPGAAGSLDAIRRLPSLRSLNLKRCAWVSDADLAALAGLPELIDLDLGQTRISDAALRQLAQLSRLRSLSLNDCDGLTDAGLEQLRSLPELTDLALDHCDRLTHSGLEACASFPALRYLSVHGVPTRRTVLWRLQSAMPLAALSIDSRDVVDLQPLWPLAPTLWINNRFEVERLDVDAEAGEVVVYDADSATAERSIYGALDFSAPPGPLPAISPPSMGDTLHTSAARRFDRGAAPPISDAALSVVADHPTIRHLMLADIPVTDAGLAVVGKLPALEYLSLRHLSITDEGLAHLASLPRLEALVLEQDSLTGEGLAALQCLPTLRRLHVSSPRLTVDGMRQIGSLAALEQLTLVGTVPADGLAQMDGLPNLRLFSATGTPIDGPAARALAKNSQLEDCSIADAVLSDDLFVALLDCPALQRLSLNNCDFARSAADRFARRRPDVRFSLNLRDFREQLAPP
jgi:Leucine-rich repeat (LRR) protein